MTGRRLLTCLLSSGTFAFVGCQTVEKTPNQRMADQLAAAQNPPSTWERMTGQRSQFRGKVRAPVSITLTDKHHSQVNQNRNRLGLSRSDFMALLVERNAA